VVVATGATVRDPFSETVPIPWLMDADVALAVVQLRIDDWPDRIESGLAEKVTVGRAALTVTVTLEVADPLLFLTVMV
jgi:hypothetical protein